MTRPIITALHLLVLWLPSPPAPAQNLLQETLRDLRVGDAWIYDDWEAARERAAAEGKPIFAVFRCVP